MNLTGNQLAVLLASQSLEDGADAVINLGDAELCIDAGLIEPGHGYKLTAKGRSFLVQ